MLSKRVIDAVKAGRFNVWAASTVDEGIEVLTGIEAGRQRADGSWTPGSINDLVQKRLIELGAVIRQTSGNALDREL